MEYVAAMLKFIVLDPLRSRGALFCLLFVALYFLCSRSVRHAIANRLNLRFDHIAVALLCGFAGIALTYVVFPNYLDHLESTIAALGGVLERSEPLYPTGDYYPFHAVNYGPALAQIQRVMREFELPVILGSKIPAVTAFITSLFILLHLNRSPTARGYLLSMLPFGAMLFWNRSEPFLLLIVAVALELGTQRVGGLVLAGLLGLLGGLASAFKIHAVLYLVAAYLMVSGAEGFSLASAAMFFVASSASFFAWYMAPNISIVMFVSYLKLSVAHGFSWSFFFGNVAYLGVLLIPIAVLYTRLDRVTFGKRIDLIVSAIVAIEFFVTILAAKPGAGVYHLMPFVPVNAFIIERVCQRSEGSESIGSLRVLYGSLLVPSIIAALMTISPMLKGWRSYGEAATEVASFDHKFRELVFGLSDFDSYPYVFLRVLLDRDQVDYPAFMDWQYSGVSDYPFVDKMRKCELPNILMPKLGSPFEMNNFFSGRPLLSDSTREMFLQKYTVADEGKYFVVYSCKHE
jgi:hypothetical protein